MVPCNIRAILRLFIIATVNAVLCSRQHIALFLPGCQGNEKNGILRLGALRVMIRLLIFKTLGLA